MNKLIRLIDTYVDIDMVGTYHRQARNEQDNNDLAKYIISHIIHHSLIRKQPWNLPNIHLSLHCTYCTTISFPHKCRYPWSSTLTHAFEKLILFCPTNLFLASEVHYDLNMKSPTTDQCIIDHRHSPRKRQSCCFLSNNTNNNAVDQTIAWRQAANTSMNELILTFKASIN